MNSVWQLNIMLRVNRSLFLGKLILRQKKNIDRKEIDLVKVDSVTDYNIFLLQ